MAVLRSGWRLVLVLAVVGMVPIGGRLRVAAAAVRGLTLIVQPPYLPANQSSTLMLQVIDSAGKAVPGTTITIRGAATGNTTLVSGAGSLSVHLTPAGSASVALRASHAGFADVAVQVPVRALLAPATVAGIQPSMSLEPVGVTLYQDARLHDQLFFRWRARTTATQRGALRFADGSVLDLDHNTVVLIKDPARTYLQTGQVFMQVVTNGQSHDLETGTAIAASLGTRYLLRVSGGVTTLTVVNGWVNFRTPRGTVSVGTNEQTRLTGSGAPSNPSPVAAAPLANWTGTMAATGRAGGENYAYLLRHGGTELDVMIIRDQQVTRTIALGRPATDVGLSRTGRDLLLATASGVLDVPLATGTPRRIGGALDAAALATLPNEQVAVADASNQAVVVLDARSGQIVRTLHLGYAPSGIAVTPDGTAAVVVGAGEVSLVDLARGALLTTRAVPGTPGRPSFAADGSLAFAPLPATGELLVLAPAARGIIARVRLGVGPGHYPAAVASEDGRVFVADGDARSIDVVDPIADRVQARLPLPAAPANVILGPDGKLAVVTHTAAVAFLILDPFDGSILLSAARTNVDQPLAITRQPQDNTVAITTAGNPVYSALIGSSVSSAEPIQQTPGAVAVATPTATATAS